MGAAQLSRAALRSARLLGAALLLAGGLLPACGGDGARDLTIVVVSLDTTRPDHLSAFGAARPTTPHLARLAAEGAVFTNARSTSSWTLPSHMSLFTGLPPGLHEVVLDFQALDLGRRTMGEIFRDAGYRTMGVFSAPYVHGRFGFKRGMDFYERGTLDPMIFDLAPGQLSEELAAREFRSHREVTSKLVVDRGLNLLRNSRSDRNLLFLHLFDPHYDYRAPAPFVKRFVDPGYKGPVTGDLVMSRPDIIHAGMPEADRRHLLDLYDAEIAWVDEQLGRVLAELEAQGRLQSTLIVVVADHGEEFFERGRIGHRAGLHDEVLRVPLLVWGPGVGVPAGLSSDASVSLCDVLPTLIDLAGLPAEPGVWGRSLRPVFEGGTLRPMPVTAALTFVSAQPRDYYVLHQSLVLDGMKVLRTMHVSWSAQDERNLAGKPDPDSVVYQVFDLAADPGETTDLYGSDDPRVARIVDAMASEDARQLQALTEFRPQGLPADSRFDMSLLDSIRATGYGAGQ